VDLPSDIEIDPLNLYNVTGRRVLNITFAAPLVQVTINGRGLDMLLDSAETGMVLDDEVAHELGLTTYGPYADDASGHRYPTRTVIASLAIGDLKMRNVFVSCRHVNRFENSVGRKAVGIIGYDFLANAVVAVDYVNRTVRAFDPAQFAPPADSVPTPINIDDDIPYVAAQIGEASGDYFLLSTLSPFTTILPAFWQAHPEGREGSGSRRAVESYHVQVRAIQSDGAEIVLFRGCAVFRFHGIPLHR
jgi:hypothetical protein